MTRTRLVTERLLFSLRGGDRLHGIAEESTARGFHLLLTGILFWTLVLLTVAMPFFTVRKTAATLFDAVLGAITLSTLYLVRARRIRQAYIFFLTTAWCLAEIFSALNGGLKGSVGGVVVLVIVNAGWLLGRSSAIGLAAATLLISLAEAVLEYYGHPLPFYFPGNPIGSWIVFAGIVLFAVGPVLSILNTLRLQVSALRESEERFHTIVDAVNDAIFVLDTDAVRIVDVNQRACEMFGYSAEEMRRLPPGSLSQGQPPYSPAAVMEHFRRMRPGVPLIVEWHSRHRDGRLFWSEVAVRRARVSGEDRLVVVLRDISERKRAEEEHARIEEQLWQAQKMESVGQLAAGVAHDFNNLLTVINGFAQLVVDQLAAAAPQRKLAEQILRAGGRAAELTSQLLAFSRKQPAHPEAVDLNRLILDSRRMLEPLLGAGIELTTALDPLLERIWADRGQMHQVLMNLAVNARDAMPDGGRLHLATAPGSPILLTAGACVTLSVSDTGHGMDAATRARVFEPFFTTKQPGKGTGLGLSTVYGIVRQSGGWIQVESEPGRGATFRIHLPASHALEAASGQAAEPIGHVRVPSTVLLVEDHAGVREYLALVLDKHGYTVLAAGTPGEALSLLRENGRRICAVVSDVIMPEMNGPEMIDRMRAVVPKVKVLFISGYPATLLSPNGTLLDGCEYLPKPILADDLLAKLDALIRG